MGLINNAISEDRVLLLLVNLRSLALCDTTRLLAESFRYHELSHPGCSPRPHPTTNNTFSTLNPSRVILGNSTLPKPVSLPTSTPLR